MTKNQCLALIALSAVTLSFGYQNCSKVGVQDKAVALDQKADAMGVQVIPPDDTYDPGDTTAGGSSSGGSMDGGSSTAGTSDGGGSMDGGGSSTAGTMDGGSSTAGTMDGGSSSGGEMNGGMTTAGTSDGGGSMDGGSSTAGTMDGGSSSGGEMNGGASTAGNMNGGSTNGGSSNGSDTPQQPTPEESELVAECLKPATLKCDKKKADADKIVGLKGGGVVQANSVPLIDKSTGKLVIIGTGSNPSIARVESHNGSLIICNMTVDYLGKETGNLVLINSHVKYLAPERRSTTHFLNSTIDNADQVRGNIHELKK